MERTCDYNPTVVCDSAECYHCGGDPEVAQERRARMPKRYKVPFTGYFEVYASSPEEAVEKADNDNVFFAHYDFGGATCLSKEECQ